MGLLVSSFVSNADKATAIVPILLIPQVILADQITPLRHFPLLIARLFIVSFWARDAMLYTISDDFTYSYSEQPFIVDLFCLIAFLGVFALVAFWGLRRKDIWRSHGDSRIRNSTATGTE